MDPVMAPPLSWINIEADSDVLIHETICGDVGKPCNGGARAGARRGGGVVTGLRVGQF